MFKTLSADSFYGDSRGGTKELETPQPLDRRLDLRFRPREPLTSDSRTWRVFERQDEALKYANRRGCGLMTFVFHSGGVGTRAFLVAHPKEFWRHDRLKAPEHRCSYEIIPEFAPCKLYLDLEFDSRLNPTSDGAQMVAILFRIIQVRLQQLYNFEQSWEDVIDLDSSTKEKFSHHLIFQDKYRKYKNNYAVGAIIKGVCENIRNWNDQLSEEYKVIKEEVASLFVKDRHGKKVLFVDEGVYTKNRHFRLYQSTKPLKNAYLKLSDQNKFKSVFLDPEVNDEFIFTCSLVSHFESFVMDLPPWEPHEEDLAVQRPFLRRPNQPGEEAAASAKFPSPYPDVDRFARRQMEAEGVRSWVHFPNTNCLVYDSRSAAFCGNVGRVHRSNKGMLVVNLVQMNFYRKCHDPDCIGYQSETKPLPSSVVTALQNPNLSQEAKWDIENILQHLEECDDDLSDF